jgi:hypothetical protein
LGGRLVHGSSDWPDDDDDIGNDCENDAYDDPVLTTGNVPGLWVQTGAPNFGAPACES